MKIKEIEPISAEYIEMIDKKMYRRFSQFCWEKLSDQNWEVISNLIEMEELEKEYKSYIWNRRKK